MTFIITNASSSHIFTQSLLTFSITLLNSGGVVQRQKLVPNADFKEEFSEWEKEELQSSASERTFSWFPAEQLGSSFTALESQQVQKDKHALSKAPGHCPYEGQVCKIRTRRLALQVWVRKSSLPWVMNFCLELYPWLQQTVISQAAVPGAVKRAYSHTQTLQQIHKYNY